MLDLGIDVLEHPVTQAQRGDGQLLHLLGPGIAGHEVEGASGVPAQGFVAGEEGQVGIDLGRDGVVVARAEMAVAAQLAILAPHHQADLGVGLQLHEAIDHLGAGPFQVTGPADIGLFVEAGLQLDHGGDRLAQFGGLGQRLDDGAVLGRAVQGLLDGHHIGVAGRLAQELHHHVEALERVVDHDVLLADGGKTVAAEVAHALGEAGIVGREQQVRAVVHQQLLGVHQADQPIQREHVDGVDMHFVGDQRAQVIGHVGIDGQADAMAPAAALQGAFEHPHQVLGLFVDFHFRVTDDAEDARRIHPEAGEQLVQEQAHHVLDGDEAHRLAGQADEAVHQMGQRHQGAQHLAVFQAGQMQHQGDAQIGDEGERMRRIDGQGRQDREHMLHEAGFQPLAVGLGQLDRLDHGNAGFAQFLAQHAPHPLLVGQQVLGGTVDGGQLLGRGQPVLGMGGHAGLDLALQAGHAHHVELVQVGRGDGQEAQPLQQGMAHILGLFQHPGVEGQPRKLAVDEPVLGMDVDGGLLGLGAGARRGVGGRHRACSFCCHSGVSRTLYICLGCGCHGYGQLSYAFVTGGEK